MNKILTSIDITGIQKFIFVSSKLKDVIRNSKIVSWITDQEGLILELKNQPEKIALAGGGNMALIFENMDKAKDFVAEFSRQVFEIVPNLGLCIVHESFESGQLAATFKEVGRKMSRKKTSRVYNGILPSLGVTYECPYTGLAANTENNYRGPVFSVEKNSKFDEKRIWKNFIENSEKYCFTNEFDKMGRTVGEKSKLAVVHIDGNSVGARLQEFLENQISGGVSDNEFLKNLNDISESLKNISIEAFKSVCGLIEKSIETNEKGIPCFKGEFSKLDFELEQNEDGKIILPIRPVILGGDDITYICDARLGLQSAEIILNYFKNNANIAQLGQVGACAGIAFVGVHYPFSRAYDFAEQLCGSAKLHEKVKEDPSNCALDWQSGILLHGQSISQLREKFYSEKDLTAKPYYISQKTDDPEEEIDWTYFSKNILGKINPGLRGSVWSERRSKLKQIYSEILSKNENLEQFIKSIQRLDSNIKFPKKIRFATGVKGKEFLIDAVELLDLYQTIRKDIV